MTVVRGWVGVAMGGKNKNRINKRRRADSLPLPRKKVAGLNGLDDQKKKARQTVAYPPSGPVVTQSMTSSLDLTLREPLVAEGLPDTQSPAVTQDVIVDRVADEVLAGNVDGEVFKLIFEGVLAAKGSKVVIREKEFMNIESFFRFWDDALAAKDKEVITGVIKSLLFPEANILNKNAGQLQDAPDQVMLTVESTMNVLQGLGLVAARLRFGPSNRSGQGVVAANTLLPGDQNINNTVLGIANIVGLFARNFNKVAFEDQFKDNKRAAEFIIAAVRDTKAAVNVLLRFPDELTTDQLRSVSSVTPFLNMVTSLLSFACSVMVNGTEQEIYESVKRSFILNVPYVLDSVLRGTFAIHNIGVISAGAVARLPVGSLVAAPAVTLFRILAAEVVHKIDLKEKERLHHDSKASLINESDAIVAAAAKIDAFYSEVSRVLAAQPADPSNQEMMIECYRLRQAAREEYQSKIDKLRGNVASTGSEMQALIKRRNVQRVIDSMDAVINVAGMFFPPAQIATIATVSMNLSMKLFGEAMILREARGNFNLNVFDGTLILTDQVSARRALMQVRRIGDPNIILMDKIVRTKYYKGHYNKDKQYFVRNNKKIVDNIFERGRDQANIMVALPHDIVPVRLEKIMTPEDLKNKKLKRGKFARASAKAAMPRPMKMLLAKMHIKSNYRKWMQNADILVAISERFDREKSNPDFHVNIRNYADMQKTMLIAGRELIDSIRLYQNRNPYDRNNEYYDKLIENIEARIKPKNPKLDEASVLSREVARLDIDEMSLEDMLPQPSIEEFIANSSVVSAKENARYHFIENTVGELLDKMAAVSMIQDNLEANFKHFKVIANRMPMLDDFDRQINEIRKYFEKYSAVLPQEKRKALQKDMIKLVAKADVLRERIVAHDEKIHNQKKLHVSHRTRQAASFLQAPRGKVSAAAGVQSPLSFRQQAIIVDPGLYDIAHAITVRHLIDDAMLQINTHPDKKEIVLMGLIPYDATVDRDTHTLKVLNDRMVGLTRSLMFALELYKRLQQEGNACQIVNIESLFIDLQNQAKLMFKRYDQLLQQNHANTMPALTGGFREALTTASVQLSLATTSTSHQVMRPFVARSTQELKDVLNEFGRVTHINTFSPFSAFTPVLQEKLDGTLARIEVIKSTIEKEIIRANQEPDRQALLNNVLVQLGEIKDKLPKKPSEYDANTLVDIKLALNHLAKQLPEVFVAKHRREIINANSDVLNNFEILYRLIQENDLLHTEHNTLRGFPRLRDVLVELVGVLKPGQQQDVDFHQVITAIESAHRLMMADIQSQPKDAMKDPRVELIHGFIQLLKNNVDGKCNKKSFKNAMQPIVAGLLSADYAEVEVAVAVPVNLDVSAVPVMAPAPNPETPLLDSLKKVNSTLKIIDALLGGMLENIKQGNQASFSPVVAPEPLSPVIKPVIVAPDSNVRDDPDDPSKLLPH